jgi:hypothetical protein
MEVFYLGPLGWEASHCKSRLVFGGDPLSTNVGPIEDESFSCRAHFASGEGEWSVKHQWPQQMSMLNEMALDQGALLF